MMWKTHATSGAALWLAGCAAATLVGHPVEPLAVIVGLPVAVLCSGAPDLDHPSSRPARSLGFVTWLISHGLAATSAALYRWTATSEDRPNGSGHRAITHTGLFCVLLGGIPALMLALTGLGSLAWLGLPIGLGSLSHLLGDACTKYGVPLLYPFKIQGRRWYSCGLPKAIRIRTDRAAEHMIVMPLLVLLTIGSGWLVISPPG